MTSSVTSPSGHERSSGYGSGDLLEDFRRSSAPCPSMAHGKVPRHGDQYGDAIGDQIVEAEVHQNAQNHRRDHDTAGGNELISEKTGSSRAVPVAIEGPVLVTEVVRHHGGLVAQQRCQDYGPVEELIRHREDQIVHYRAAATDEDEANELFVRLLGLA